MRPYFLPPPLAGEGRGGGGPTRARSRMNEAPHISVIVPHLNQHEVLEKCLRSLQEQSCPAGLFEVIVIDNGSSAPPRDIVAGFDFARLDIEMRPGPGPARNRGASLSRGPILAFIDADCTADPDWLGVIHRTFALSPEGTIIGGDVRIAFRDPSHLTALEAYESVFAYRQREYIERFGFSGTGNLAVRRRDFDAIGPFPGIDEAEDSVWGRRAGALGYRIKFVPDMIVFHPARRSFDELAAKWNRHIHHDYTDWTRRGRGRPAWLARSVAVAVSGIIDGHKVLTSRKIAGVGARLRALAALARIRLHRSRRMVQVLLSPRDAAQELSWNRPLHPR